MKEYVVLDNEKFVVAIADSPLSVGEHQSIEIDIPSDFDYDRMSCYNYIDGAFVYNKERAEQIDRENAEFEQSEAARVAAEDTFKRLLARQLAQTATLEEMVALAPLTEDA